jgi:nicotinate dehydrogenase subunit B
MNTSSAPSRRDFLTRTGALVVAFSLMRSSGDAIAQDLPAAKRVALDEVDSFLGIDEKGLVTVYSGKVELGTGIRTGFTQIVADELDVPMANVYVIQGDTALTPDQGPTYGSLSTEIGGVQIRQAAATARMALLDEAARRLGAAKEDLIVTNGAIGAKSGGDMITYAQLIGGRTSPSRSTPRLPQKTPTTTRSWASRLDGSIFQAS